MAYKIGRWMSAPEPMPAVAWPVTDWTAVSDMQLIEECMKRGYCMMKFPEDKPE